MWAQIIKVRLKPGMDDRVVALAMSTGKELWKSKCKIDGVAEFMGVAGDKELTVLCPGKYKMQDDVYEKEYSIHRIGLEKGDARWSFSDGNDIRLWWLQDDGRICAFEEKRYLELDPESGKPAMKLKAKRAWKCVSADQKLYLFGKDGVACFDRGASSPLWETELKPYGKAISDNSMSKCFTVAGATVLFPTRNAGVAGLSATDGSKLWAVQAPKDPKTYLSKDEDFMAIVNGKVIEVIDFRELRK